MVNAWVPAPAYNNYASFLENMISSLPDQYRRGQAQDIALQNARQQQGVNNAFPNGLPMGANGLPDLGATAQRLGQVGGWRDELGLLPALQQQQQAQQAQDIYNRGQTIPQASNPQSLPPASAAGGIPARRGPQEGANAQTPAQGQSVNGLVASSLPANYPQESAVAQNVAKALKVEPNAPLSDAQMQQARKYLASYAQRRNVQPQDGGNLLPMFAAAGGKFGVSPDYLARTAQLESRMDPNASNPSGAKGLMEFMPGTARQYGVSNPFNPEQSINGAARLAADNKASLEKALGRVPTDAELYLAHQQGATGAAKLLENPDAKASSIVGMKAVIQNGGRPDMTAGQFAQMWTDRFNKTGAGTSNFALSGGVPGGPGATMPAGLSGAPVAAQMPGVGFGQPLRAAAGLPAPQAFQGQAQGLTPDMIDRAQQGMTGPDLAAPAQAQQAQDAETQAYFAHVRDTRAKIAGIDDQIEKIGMMRLGDAGQPIINRLEQQKAELIDQMKPLEIKRGEAALDPYTGKPIYRAPESSISNIAAQRFLEEHPDATATELQAFQQAGRSARSGVAMFMNKFLQENPNATAEDVARAAQNFQSQGTGLTRFTSGPQGNAIKSFNVLVDHLGTLGDAVNALRNGDIRMFNRLGNEFARQTGGTAPTDFDATKALVGDEIIKAVIGGGGTLADREEAKATIDRANSPAQLYGVVGQYKKLALGQLHGLQQQYESATGRDDFDKKLSPGTRDFFEGKSGGQSQRQTGGDIPSAAADYLKANPNLRTQFDEKYGRGAAAKVLGE